QRKQRIDIAGGFRRRRGARLGGCGRIGKREAARRGASRIARRRAQRRAVRSVDAHGRGAPQRESLGGTIASPWLMMRKQPGKICRIRQFRADWREREVAPLPENFERNQSIDSAVANGTRLAWIRTDGASWECRGGTANSRGVVGMPGIRKAKLIWGAIAFVALALGALPASATSRIKDLANIEGVRQNQLIGYGLVVGLNGTGDTLNNIPFTK